MNSRVSRYKLILILLVLPFISATGTSHAATVSNPADKQVEKNGADVVQPEYVIGPEDVLRISVWKNDELSKTVVVRPDGRISMPLIGDVRAAGHTPVELQDEIINRLKEYQETVVASVIVEEVNSYRIFIVGEVIKPGAYLMKTRTTLLQAIALAGGFNQFASKNKIVLVRQKNDGKGGVEKLRVRFDDLVYSDTNSMILKPGDTIFVP